MSDNILRDAIEKAYREVGKDPRNAISKKKINKKRNKRRKRIK